MWPDKLIWETIYFDHTPDKHWVSRLQDPNKKTSGCEMVVFGATKEEVKARIAPIIATITGEIIEKDYASYSDYKENHGNV